MEIGDWWIKNQENYELSFLRFDIVRKHKSLWLLNDVLVDQGLIFQL